MKFWNTTLFGCWWMGFAVIPNVRVLAFATTVYPLKRQLQIFLACPGVIPMLDIRLRRTLTR